jgi:large subunit ribosomal protein L3
LLGHFKKANTTPKRKVIELKGFVRDWKTGDVITVDYFKDDIWLDVAGISKGKGFQGVVKDMVSAVWVMKPTVSTTV